jgi:predicted esterase
MKTAIAILVLLMLVLSGCGDSGDELGTITTGAPASTTTTAAPASATTEASPEVTKGLVYATWGEEPLTLDMHVPADPAGAPIVVYLPGGGQNYAPPGMAEGLVAEGAIVVVVRIAENHNPELLPPSSDAEVLLGNRGAGARAQADSVACAIHFTRTRASELGSSDPVVVLSGFCGGGGIAAHVALFGAGLEARWDEFAAEGGPPRQVECEAADGSTHVDALVTAAGTYDVFVPTYDGKWGRAYQQERHPELWTYLSSSVGLNPDLKIRLIHGETDELMPYENSVEFRAMLTDAGYDVPQILAFPWGHYMPFDLAIETIQEVIRPGTE